MFKLGVEGDQLIPDADKAGFLSQLRSLPQKARADGAERQDGGTAPIPAFQVLDDRLAVRFLFCIAIPKAVSLATVYGSGTFNRSATGPKILCRAPR